MLSLTEQWHLLSTCLGAKHSTHPVMPDDDLLARIHLTLAESSSLTTQLKDTKISLDECDLASRP
jgi:hypothetical protein